VAEYQLFEGDCLEVMPTLEAGSVDLVLTDPPYEAKYSHLWEPLAREAARVLKPGGSLISLCGHYQVPFVIDALSKHLRYWWLLSMEHPGNLNRFPGKWVCIRHKPAVWYVKSGRIPGDTRCPLDSLAGGSIDGAKKSHAMHKWGQPTDWFEHYIDRLTSTNDVILDPFMGSGTTGHACLNTNRRFIGIERDAGYFATAVERMAKAAAAPRQEPLELERAS
jgi:site-specific DNA-methyltransferase (adenine-specific)